MARNNDLGRWGEQCAAKYMEEKGWYVRHRNWQKNHHEIDLVCIDEDSTILLFIEVKTRASDKWGQPDESIDLEKKNNLIKAARSYLFDFHLQHIEVRYDTISIIGTPETGYEVIHKEGAFNVEDQYEYYRARKRRRPEKGLWKRGMWRRY